MTPEALRLDLSRLSAKQIVGKWYGESIPFIFGSNRSAYHSFRARVATGIGVSQFDVIIVGSAATGLSLDPEANLSAFSRESDIDLAIVSYEHFETGWRWLRELGATIYALPPAAQKWVKEHERRLVYWGAIATDQLLPHMTFGTRWLNGFAELKRDQEFSQVLGDREISVRIYRDFPSLEGTLMHGIGKLQIRHSEEAKVQ